MATVKQWTRGRCAGCSRHRSIYGGLCVPCRQPEKQRVLVDHGVPPMSADCLARLVKRCRERKKTTVETQTLLEMLHPILMENVRVTEAGSLLLRDEKQIWIRRGQWKVGQIEDPS